MFDVVIVGGGFAGHAAAMQLGRARRSVLLVDAKRPRNRFAAASHGFPGQDGSPPDAIHATFSQQLSVYKTVIRAVGEVVGVARGEANFVVAMADGELIATRRIILAGGVSDTLPAIPGLKERWGASVLHCPYCHGFELNMKPIGVLGDSDLAFHQSMLVRDWGPTTLFTQGSLTLSTDQRNALDQRDIQVETTPITALSGEDAELDAVQLSDGREHSIAGLYVAPKTKVVGDLALKLGCVFESGPTGDYIATDDQQQTSVSGVFAAGDAAAAMSNATLAAAAGVRAGAAAHATLIFGLSHEV